MKKKTAAWILCALLFICALPFSVLAETATDAPSGDRRVTLGADLMFRCYSCFQYVAFVKGNVYRPYFKHSASETSKDCEDRSLIYSSGTYSPQGQIDAPDPLRLILDRNRVVLEIGFLPASVVELKKAILLYII